MTDPVVLSILVGIVLLLLCVILVTSWRVRTLEQKYEALLYGNTLRDERISRIVARVGELAKSQKHPKSSPKPKSFIIHVEHEPGMDIDLTVHGTPKAAKQAKASTNIAVATPHRAAQFAECGSGSRTPAAPDFATSNGSIPEQLL